MCVYGGGYSHVCVTKQGGSKIHVEEKGPRKGLTLLKMKTVP
jgi:hypothetical protein